MRRTTIKVAKGNS